MISQPIMPISSLAKERDGVLEEKKNYHEDIILSKNSMELFINTIFTEKYTIYKIHEFLQAEGKRIAFDKNLNNQTEENNTGIVIRIGNKNYILFCNLEYIKSFIKPENKRYVNSENVRSAAQYCIDNIGFLIPFIIERSRYELQMNKQAVEIESNLQELNTEILAYGIPIIDQIRDSFVYIIFQCCIAEEETFYKIMTLLLYELTKNKKEDVFVKKDLLSKMIDFIIRLSNDGLNDNMPLIKKNIEAKIDEMAMFEDLYKMNKILLYNSIYRIIKYPLIKKIFTMNAFLDDSYFLSLLQSSNSHEKNDLSFLFEENANKKEVKENKSDLFVSTESAKNKQVLNNIKKMFIKNNNE